MSNQRNFLVPVDFQAESELALEYALMVAQKVNAKLHLLFMIEEESSLHKLVLNDKQRELIRNGALDQIDKITGRVLSHSGISFTTAVKQGKVYTGIIQTAKDVNVDVIFMGRTNASDMVKNFTGTNTMHIIRESRVPVVTLRKKPEYMSCSHIVLPLDLTKQTVVQASNAIAAALMLNAKISVVSLMSGDSKAQEIKFLTGLDEIRNIIEKLDIECGVKLVPVQSTDIYQSLNKTVHELQGDLVMIMTQQELNMTEFFVGSFAQQVINSSEFPVMSINPLAPELKIIPDPLLDAFLNPVQIFDS